MIKWQSINGKDVISPEYVKRLFALGEQCESKDDVYAILSTLHQCDSIANAVFGGYNKARGKWTTDFSTEVKTWRRFGNVQYDEMAGDFCSSFNHAEGRKEKGVSVMDEDWKNTVSAQFFSGDIYEFEGIQVAWGSDGEPLVIPTSIPKKVSK